MLRVHAFADGRVWSDPPTTQVAWWRCMCSVVPFVAADVLRIVADYANGPIFVPADLQPQADRWGLRADNAGEDDWRSLRFFRPLRFEGCGGFEDMLSASLLSRGMARSDLVCLLRTFDRVLHTPLHCFPRMPRIKVVFCGPPGCGKSAILSALEQMFLRLISKGGLAYDYHIIDRCWTYADNLQNAVGPLHWLGTCMAAPHRLTAANDGFEVHAIPALPSHQRRGRFVSDLVTQDGGRLYASILCARYE